MNNGLYNGLDNGLHSGLYQGQQNGLSNGLFNNEIKQVDVDVLNYLNLPQMANLSFSQKSAVSRLVRDLKLNCLWEKLYAIYPFLGGTAGSCKWNLKDPRDLDDAYRLTFSGGWTFSSTGALPNGTNGYADTHINPSTNLISNSTHMSYYSTTNNNVATVGISLVNYLLLFVRKNTPSLFGVYTNPLRGGNYFSNIRGLWIVSRVNGTEFFSYNKFLGHYDLYTSETPKPRENGNIYLAARNEGSASLFSDQNCNFATIGAGLTVAECSTLTTIITQFYTDLGQ